jgi:hypothetical protein
MLSRIGLLLFVGVVVLPVGDAAATTLRIEWIGEATTWYPDQDPDNAPVLVETISVPVKGFLAIDVEAARVASLDLGGDDLSWSWSNNGLGHDYNPAWSMESADPVTWRWLIDDTYADCTAWCDLYWNSSDPADGFLLWAESDPISTWFQIHADGTGTWGFGVVPWRTVEYGYVEGIVTHSTTTLIPEPSAALVFAIGLAIASRVSRRTRPARA